MAIFGSTDLLISLRMSAAFINDLGVESHLVASDFLQCHGARFVTMRSLDCYRVSVCRDLTGRDDGCLTQESLKPAEQHRERLKSQERGAHRVLPSHHPCMSSLASSSNAVAVTPQRQLAVPVRGVKTRESDHSTSDRRAHS